MIPLRYAALDLLPERLRDPVIAHPHGHIDERVATLALLRDELLRGKVPPRTALRWPEAELAVVLHDALARSGVAAACKGNPEIVDEVILTLVESSITTERFLAAAQDHFLALGVIAAAKQCNVAVPDDLALDAGKCAGWCGVTLGRDALAKVKEDARRLSIQMACEKLGVTLTTWNERLTDMLELRDLLVQCAPAWFSRASVPLHALARTDAPTLREALRRLRELAELLQELGRRLQSPLRSPELAFEAISGALRRPVARVDERIPEASVEVRGLERSDEIARMLASEAVSLMHPRLRWLWHARRAERALLCYHAEGAGMTEVLEEYGEGDVPQRKPSDRGPVLVCLDVSGSMAGAPGKIAQAVTLHVALSAMAEERACHVFSFSGPGDVVEHAIGTGEAGVEGILTFLLLVFAGGTDVEEPLRRALEKQEHERFRNADVLIVTDGAFPVDRTLTKQIERAKETRGLRVHGLVIGPGDLDATARVCTTVHRLADWVR